ncbi:EamA family transporter [Endozoicomonas sp. OPT23]|uniref:DMT family transporter n=1 Tax=Endozoicomonas sp. OPT23 TaxID=2072845 RepID=UPI00129A941A|nr:DMT family transporter [Endozoicomonas sp. OPT23]MRI34690.1 EamA family transporter [Endozoicomonas sp. OPT23]
MTTETRACLYALATALLWSTIATAFKLTLTYIDPWQMVFWPVVTSILFLSAAVLIQRKGCLVVRQAKESWKTYLVLGLFNPFLYHLLLFKSYNLLPAQQAQALNYTWPLALTLLSSLLLGKKLTVKDSLCCLAAYFGVFIISTGGDIHNMSFDSPLGVILMLMATLVWALYWTYSTKQSGDSLVSLLLCFLFGLPWITTATLWQSSIWPIPLEGLAGAVYIGLIEMGIAYIFWLKALKLTENTALISNISYLSPFLSLIFISQILNEIIAPATYIGLVMIIAAVLFQQGIRTDR